MLKIGSEYTTKLMWLTLRILSSYFHPELLTTPFQPSRGNAFTGMFISSIKQKIDNYL